MSVSKIGVAVFATAAAGAVALGGAALANAATIPGTPTVAVSSDGNQQTPSASADTQVTGDGNQQGPGVVTDTHTPVTGDELTKVTAAVQAKDSTVTVTTVRKDLDGSYDVLGTKAGAPVRYQVSADLQTITEDTRRGPGGPGATNDTPVTGDELTKVTAAVQAKDSTITVTTVRKDPDGSYDVLGIKGATKAGAEVRYQVSADLTTITENAGHGGHR